MSFLSEAFLLPDFHVCMFQGTLGIIMSRVGVSKISVKSALFALGVMVMLIGMNAQTNVGAVLENKIALSSDITHFK